MDVVLGESANATVTVMEGNTDLRWLSTRWKVVKREREWREGNVSFGMTRLETRRIKTGYPSCLPQ